MIVEHASIVVKPGQEAAFEQAVAHAARTVLPQAQGFRGIVLHCCIEEPSRYICALEWNALEDHTVRFREGPHFPAWRVLVGPHFAQPPEVRHYEILQTL